MSSILENLTRAFGKPDHADDKGNVWRSLTPADLDLAKRIDPDIEVWTDADTSRVEPVF